MQKTFSTLTIKSFDEDEGIIRGIATTPTTDKVGDVVEPLGAQFVLPIPLHHEHDRKDVVGEVIEATASADGIEFTARVAKDVSDQIAEVWKRVKGGLIRFVSVGFRPLEYENIEGGYRFTKWAWDELSLTTIPANPQAAITAAKALPKTPISIEGNSTMTIAEQIAQFEQKKSAALAGMDTLIQKGVTLQGDDEAAYARHEAEVADIEKHLARLKEAEARSAKSARPVQGVSVTVESNLPKGVGFVAATKAMIAAHGNPHYAAELVKSAYGDNAPRIEQFIRQKGAMPAQTTTTHSALTTPGALASEFIEMLNNAHIVGQLQGFRVVPHGVKIPRQASGSAAYWTGEGQAIPLTNNGVDDIDIDRFKLAAIATFSRELLQLGSPSIDALLRDTLIEATAAEIDKAFIISTNAGSAAKPKAITNGLTPINASGVGPQHVRTDVKAALDKFSAVNMGTDGAVWLMHSVTASALTFMRNAMGGAAFPGMTINGGNLLGLPVLVSNSVPGDGTAGYDLVLVKPSEIFRPEAPGLEIAASNEASLEMLDSSLLQNSTTGTGATQVSMFQSDLTALRVITFDGWYPRRLPCAVRIAGTKYDAAAIETVSTVNVTP